MNQDQLVRFLAHFFAVHRYPAAEQGGFYLQTDRPVRRLGLALEPAPDLVDWVVRHRLDAVWLHRPWKLDRASWPAGVGLLFHHLPFDEHLTIGYNPLLAEVLGLQAPEPIGYKQAESLPPRPIGMIGAGPAGPAADWSRRISEVFGGIEHWVAGQKGVLEKVAVVGAMNEALIREAVEKRVDLYVTGQYRPAAGKAVAETGLAVLAVGHHRSEQWGLRALATVLRDQWPDLEVTPYAGYPNNL